MQRSTACLDWADRLKNGKSIIPPPIYRDQANQALEIFKQLRVVDLPGKPTFGECSEDWVFDFVAAIFGAYDAETGNQLIREFFLLISKKNTKSTIAAGIMLTAVILCWREDEEHLILAPTKEVADNSFKPAAGMIRADNDLASLFHVQDHVRTITHRVTRASLKVVAADTDTVSGKKSGRIMVDELWAFGKKPNADAMFMEATGGQVSRNEGWVIFLSTQSDDPPSGAFKEKLEYHRNVRDGIIHDPKSLPVIYEFPPDMIKNEDFYKPEYFRITNPNIGRSVSHEWLVDQLKRNRGETDGKLQKFLAKHLNVEIGLGLRNDRWPGADFWQAAVKPCTLDDLLDRCEVIALGIDGGGLDDLLGAYAVGRVKDSQDWIGWGYAWAHPSVLERRKEIAPKLQDFAKLGEVTLVQNVGDDISELADIAERIYDAGLLDKIGVDPIGLGSILDALEERQIPPEKIIGVSQGWKLGGAIKTAERRIAAASNPKLAGANGKTGSFSPADQALMAWCVSNARCEPRANSIMITKQVSGSGKIDPLMAMFNAITLMALNPPAATKKYQMFVLG